MQRHLESMSGNKVAVEIKIFEKIVNKKTSFKNESKLNNKANDEEIFNKVVDLFDGEILR